MPIRVLKKDKDKKEEQKEKPESGSSVKDIFKSYGKYDGKPIELKRGGLSPKQKKIAAKAPPPDKIDAKDFAVLKAEKAKGRGMGLQDESIKPGKVMKAKYGKSIDKKAFMKTIGVFPKVSGAPKNLNKAFMKTVGVLPTINKVTPTVKGKELSKASDILKKKKLPGAIGTALGIGAMMVPAAYAAAKQYKDYKSAKNRDEAKVKKMGGGMMKKYSTGMTLADMKPYGGSYVKKKAEMKASQTENVKQLTTSDDAYSPEKMFVVTRGTKKDNRARPTRIRVTDDWNAKKIVDRENSRGMNTESIASYKLPPAYQRDYERRQQVLQNLRDKPRSYSGPTKKMPSRRTDLKPRPMISKFKSGVMVKVKLGRNKPTKIC